ncbi:uncharacterized protein LOC122266193, partial [Penaeus japonicus]|uniref:uncharacterized protein LOC122266193 n=1 Tax=Penaeus japonicus TaxID=27405 RepID=UPI001C70C623
MLRIFRLLMLTIWIQEIFARPYHLQEPLPPNSLAPLIEQFASRTSSSSSFRPGAFEVDSALRKLHRQPRSVRTSASEVSSQQQQPQLSYRSSHQVKFRLKGVYQLFLRGSSSGVSAGHQGHLSNQVCFRVHTFHATPAYPEGYVVALETPTGGSVLKGVGNNVSLVVSSWGCMLLVKCF